MLNIFSCVFWLSVCLWRNVHLGLLPIFVWVLCFFWYRVVWVVCISEIKPLFVTSLENISSHSVDSLFVLFMVSFSVQKLLNLIRSHLFTFAFISFAFGDWPKKMLWQFMSENVLLMFSFRSLWYHGLYLSL